MSTYRSRRAGRARQRMSVTDWWIAVAMALPWLLLIALVAAITVFG